jgi:2-methylisocitrate lyase-like PEP mutase family enzyme
MSRTIAEKRASFRALHREGCFLLPNPWDIGSARIMQHLGFEAIASTSSGYAWTMGKPDYEVSRDDVLKHLKAMSDAVDLPVNADFESGFADSPEGVAANVKMAVDAGVCGLSIEDRDGTPTGLYDEATSVERVAAARKAIDETGGDVVLVARTEGLLVDQGGLAKAIDKLVAFAAAGADCLYAPGVWAVSDIRAMVGAVAPKPLNVLALGGDLSLSRLADLGVRRVSVGGAIARNAWRGMVSASRQFKAGSFEDLASGASDVDLNDIFARFTK